MGSVYRVYCGSRKQCGRHAQNIVPPSIGRTDAHALHAPVHITFSAVMLTTPVSRAAARGLPGAECARTHLRGRPGSLRTVAPGAASIGCTVRRVSARGAAPTLGAARARANVVASRRPPPRPRPRSPPPRRESRGEAAPPAVAGRLQSRNPQ
eukprot:6173898-Pleurochrysis_carterae.AAC.3